MTWQEAAEQVVEHVELIAKDVRDNGDAPLVRIDADGAGRIALTLADELWLSVAPLRSMLMETGDAKGSDT